MDTETISRSECEEIAQKLGKISKEMREDDSDYSSSWAWSLDSIVCSLRGLFKEAEILSAEQEEYEREVHVAIEECEKTTKDAQKVMNDHNAPYNERYWSICKEARKQCDERLDAAIKKLDND